MGPGRAGEGECPAHSLELAGSPHLLLCWPVRCRKAFRVALRSSLIFSCREKSQHQGQGAQLCKHPAERQPVRSSQEAWWRL